MKNNYEKSEKLGRLVIENNLFCEIDEECIYKKKQGIYRNRIDEYAINEDVEDGHNSDNSNAD